MPAFQAIAAEGEAAERHLLYVAVPGVRDYLEYGGHGLLVFDIDDGHKFVKRIATAGVDETGRPLNVKGICASANSGRLYISTIKQLMCLDLVSEKVLWEKKYDAGCDRMSITPDGATIYLPSLEGPHWYVVDGEDGESFAQDRAPTPARTTRSSGCERKDCLSGRLKSPCCASRNSDQEIVRRSARSAPSIRPFTVNGRETLCFVNVNELLGFEVGDLTSGEKLCSVRSKGFKKGPTKRHGCPSHGIGLTPDEKEIWLTDAANSRMHIFDATVMPPKQLESIELRDQPGWITF